MMQSPPGQHEIRQPNRMAKYLQDSSDLYPDIPLMSLLEQISLMAMDVVKQEIDEENPHVLSKIAAGWKNAMVNELLDGMHYARKVETDKQTKKEDNSITKSMTLPVSSGSNNLQQLSVSEKQTKKEDNNTTKSNILPTDGWSAWEAAIGDNEDYSIVPSLSCIDEELKSNRINDDYQQEGNFNEVSDIEDEEPKAQDILLCQVNSVVRPVKKRNILTQWECTGHQGHIRLMHQELMFSSVTCVFSQD